ncbi:MAG: hypothetical protein AAB011_13540 [Candidatus Eisenbacteria bacterium]
MDVLIVKALSLYRIVGRIGAGGIGVLYRAQMVPATRALILTLSVLLPGAFGCAKHDPASLGYAVATENLSWNFPDGLVDTTGAFVVTGTPNARQSRTSGPGQMYLDAIGKHELLVYWGARPSESSRAPYSVECRREFKTPEEDRLLRIAEETYPGKASVVAKGPELEKGRTSPASEVLRPWAFNEVDGVQAPYAVTMDGVRYYVARVRAYAGWDSSSSRGIWMKTASFQYSASISPKGVYSREGRVFHDVWIVELSMRWASYCGNLCSVGFSHDRTVLLDRAGAVLAVFGDRSPKVMVS